MERWEVRRGDCVEVMRSLPEASVDAVVCDPPYGLEFMGREWDTFGRGGAESRATAVPSSAGGHSACDGRPTFLGGLNPRCRVCNRSQRGGSPCRCEKPDFSDERGPRLRAFQAWCEQWATEALRVLRPGGHLLAFGGTRTYHRLACAIEDAGFEIRDCIAWLYGSGFPKSLDVSKAIDKRPGVTQHAAFAAELRAAITAKGYTNTFDVAEEVVGRRTGAVANWQKYQWPEAKWWPALRDLLGMDSRWDAIIAEAERVKTGERASGDPVAWYGQTERSEGIVDVTAPATPEAQRWQGWGTALKPAHEPIVVARKPLAGTVAQNVLEHGTGALNIDGCRIGTGGQGRWASPRGGIWSTDSGAEASLEQSDVGRWPANVTLDEEAARMLDEQTGELHGPGNRNPSPRRGEGYGGFTGESTRPPSTYPHEGGASRFLYVAKASQAERNAGLDGFEERAARERHAYSGLPDQRMTHEQARNPSRNVHPTVKPIALMRWLVRLVTPPNGLVLDPFTGSGTTGCAATLEGFRFLGIEREPEYADLAEARIRWWSQHPPGTDTDKALKAGEERDRIARAGQAELFGAA